jgi:hypothetical protein
VSGTSAILGAGVWHVFKLIGIKALSTTKAQRSQRNFCDLCAFVVEFRLAL